MNRIDRFILLCAFRYILMDSSYILTNNSIALAAYSNMHVLYCSLTMTLTFIPELDSFVENLTATLRPLVSGLQLISQFVPLALRPSLKMRYCLSSLSLTLQLTNSLSHGRVT